MTKHADSMRCDTFTSRTSGMRGLIYSPSNEDNGGRTLLYLHGRGGFGTGVPGLFEYPDLPRLLREGLQLTSRVVVPSCDVADRWEPSLVNAFLDDLEDAYPCDGKHDVVGYSRGGSGAYRFAAAFPARVRTLAIISASAIPEIVADIAALPTLICHGIHDPYKPVADARAMHDALRAAGCNCTLELIDGDHFIVGEVFASGAVFRWQSLIA